MRLLIDTNIILDFFLKREGTQDARDLFILAASGKEDEFVSASTVTDILYLLIKSEKERNKKRPEAEKRSLHDISVIVQSKVTTLFSFLEVLPVTSDIISEALSLKWDDPEDAVQFVVALHNNVDCIITRNKADYTNSTIKVMTPSEFLSGLSQ